MSDLVATSPPSSRSESTTASPCKPEPSSTPASTTPRRPATNAPRAARADILTDLLLTAAPEADPTRTDDGPGTSEHPRPRPGRRPGPHDPRPHRRASRPRRPHRARPPRRRHRPQPRRSTTLPWDRVITHPVTGAVLHTDTYHRTTAIDRYRAARDRRCRWPGCTVPAIRCEVDHTRDHASAGPPHVANLAHLCQRHHTQKQFTRWSVKQLPGGILQWTSPTGRTYTDEPLPYSPRRPLPSRRPTPARPRRRRRHTPTVLTA